MTSDSPSNLTRSGKRGFAGMSPEKRREAARKGGQSVPKEKRTFSQSADIARKAGTKGGKNVAPEKRAFSVDNDLAVKAAKLSAAKRPSKRSDES